MILAAKVYWLLQTNWLALLRSKSDGVVLTETEVKTTIGKRYPDTVAMLKNCLYARIMMLLKDIPQKLLKLSVPLWTKTKGLDCDSKGRYLRQTLSYLFKSLCSCR